MASSGGVTLADGVPQLYFCHECERTASISPNPNTGDLLCPTCNSGFVEEYQNPNPNPNPNIPDPISLFLSQFLLSNPNSQSPLPFDAASYLINLLANRRASGVDFQFVLDGANNAPSGSGFSLQGANIGDYFVGPGFEQLIQQLAENDPNRYGTPPAAKSAVEALPTVKVDGDLMKSELAQCAVCKDDFEMDTLVKQMPCNHVYHDDCIRPWLDLHNSCPVCRYELPTDDPDYENRASLGSGGGNSNNSNDSAPGSQERRFTVTLPWLFGGFGSGSGSGSGSSGGDSDQQNRESY